MNRLSFFVVALLVGCSSPEPQPEPQGRLRSARAEIEWEQNNPDPNRTTVLVRLPWKDIVEFQHAVREKYTGINIVWNLYQDQPEEAPTYGELKNFPDNKEALDFLRGLPNVVNVHPVPRPLTADDYHLPPVRVENNGE